MKITRISLFIVLLAATLIFPTNMVAQTLPCFGSPPAFTVNPAPTPIGSGFGYAPGTVVTYCLTISNYSQAGSNWLEGIDINLGAGWLAGSLTPVTYPQNFGGAASGGQWIWVNNSFNINGYSFGPGFFFDLNNNGISQDDFGDSGGGPWGPICFSVTVGNTPFASLSVGAYPVSDGFAGSWGAGLCSCLPTPCPGPLPPYPDLGSNGNTVIGCGTLIPSVTGLLNVSCNGGNNGSFSINTANGNAPFQFSFQGGAYSANNSFSNLSAGSYTVTIQDATGCTVPFPVNITQPNNPLALTLIFKNNVGCFGASNGNYRVIGTGGTGPYTYSTDGGVTYVPGNQGPAFQVANLPMGTYTVFVKDANGCTATLDIPINQPAALTGSITAQTNLSCAGTGTGSVTVVGSNGTPVYTYSIGGAYQLSGTFNNLAVGAYTVTIKDANNCSTTVPVTIIQPTNPTGSVLSQTDVDCNGAATGSFTAQAINGTAPYTYSLNGGAFGGATFNNLSAANYTVTVQDANGCTSNFNVNIAQPNVLNLVVLSQVNINCFGASTGEITLGANGGTAPYSYALGSTSNSTGNFTGLSAANNVIFDVTDNNGCTANVAANITQPAVPMSALITVQNNVLCSGTNTGNVTIQGSNGNNPYTYSLNSTTNNTGVFNNLGVGSYNVTVTDATGCTFIQPVNISSPTALASSVVSVTDVTCFGGSNGALSVSANNGTNPYTYTLGATNNATGTFNGLSAGNYTIVVTDQNGCTLNQPVTVNEPLAALSSTITAQTAVNCFAGNDGSVAIIATGGTAGYNYTLGALNNLTGQFNNLSAGNYIILVTDANACTYNQNVLITQPAAALGGNTLSVIDVACFGDNTGQFSVTGTNGTAPYNYNCNAQNNNSGTFSGLIQGNYNVIITDNNNCTFTHALTIAQPAAALSAGIGSQTDVTCFNGNDGSLTIAASNGTAPYLYGLAGTTLIPVNTITNLIAGAYNITIQDANNCSITINANVLQPAQPVAVNIVSQNDVPCFGDLNGSFTLAASNGTAPYTYTSNGNTNTTGIFNNVAAGNYTINVTDNFGCPSNLTLAINQPAAALTASIVNYTNPLCTGGNNGNATVDVSGGTVAVGYNYQWNTSPIQNTAQATNLIAGNYSVTVTDDNACVAIANVTLTEPNFQLTSTPSASICAGESVSLSAASLDGAFPVVYTWTNQTDATSTVGAQITISPASSVNYTVIATDANGCSTPPNIASINVNPTPSALFNEDFSEGCRPLCVSFTAAPNIISSSLQWDFGDTQTNTGNNVTNCFDNQGIFTVTLTAISDSGCISTITKTDGIIVHDIPVADFTAEPTETTMANPKITLNNLSVAADEYRWDFDNNTTSTDFQPELTYNEPGAYCIKMMALNDYGCTDSSTVCLSVKSEQTLFMPNSFTPNGDGLNDTFTPYAQSTTSFLMTIFNRWGQQIYTTTDATVGWNGGSEIQGVYQYVVELTTITGEQKIFSGDFTLYR